MLIILQTDSSVFRLDILTFHYFKVKPGDKSFLCLHHWQVKPTSVIASSVWPWEFQTFLLTKVIILWQFSIVAAVHLSDH